MKKTIFTLICSILIAATAFADESAKLSFSKFREVDREEGNLMMQMLETVRKQGGQGWRDGNDNRPAALIRVKLENIPLSEAKNIRFETSSHNSLQYDYSKVSDRHEIWLWSDGDREDIFIKATYKGASTIYNISKIKPKTTYDAVLHSEELINIVVNVKPEGARIQLENGMSAITPAPIYDVAPGMHTLTIEYRGNIQKHDIEVSDKSFTFPETGYYDMREKKNVVLVSEPKAADLFMLTDNGTYDHIGKAGRAYSLIYGPTTVIARIGEKADTVQFNVDENTDFIQFNPVRKKRFEATAYYGGSKVPALLYINGDMFSNYQQESYSLNLPIGETYNLEMSYFGNTKARQIHVSETMDPIQVFKIERKSTFVWPWQKEFYPSIAGISVGYVNKQYVTRGENEKLEQDIWGSSGKSMHGVQAGFYWTPAFRWGLGIYTGLFYEGYFSSNSDYEDFDEYIEHCLYMPVHAYYRLPLGPKVHIAIHGGIGMDYAFSGSFSNSDSLYDDWTDFYGEEGFPKRFNLSGEFGLDLRFGAFGISASISRGILDHKMYDSQGNYESVQNKMSISISYVIGGSDD